MTLDEFERQVFAAAVASPMTKRAVYLSYHAWMLARDGTAE